MLSRRTWRWNMNYRSNHREVVRTLSPPTILFISSNLLSVSLLVLLSCSPKLGFCSLDHPHNNNLHSRWIVFQHLWLFFCSLLLWKKKNMEESKIKRSTSSVPSQLSFPLQSLFSFFLCSFPLLSSSFIYIFLCFCNKRLLNTWE